MNNIDNLDHNKLRVYRQFKASFSREPYIEHVRNRNQRSSLTRLRVSAHSLATELGRRTRPITPYHRRICTNCQTNTSNTGGSIDTELHFLIFCDRFESTRNCLFNRIELIHPGFSQLSNENKFLTLMCPTNPQFTKLVSRSHWSWTQIRFFRMSHRIWGAFSNHCLCAKHIQKELKCFY